MSSTASGLIPLPTPFWSTTSNNPTCGATINDSPQNQTYCCNGLLLDITQGILGPTVNQNPIYFKDLRCCSGDPNVALASVTLASVTLASVTFCTAGTQGELVTSMGNEGSSTSQGLTTTSENGGATRTSTTTTAAGTSMTVTATATVKSEGRSKVTNLSVARYVCLFLGILGVLSGY